MKQILYCHRSLQNFKKINKKSQGYKRPVLVDPSHSSYFYFILAEGSLRSPPTRNTASCNTGRTPDGHRTDTGRTPDGHSLHTYGHTEWKP